MSATPRVVFAQDWLRTMRGGEQCLEALAPHYPDAPVLTLLHKRDEIAPAINAHPITTSFLQGLPGIHRYYPMLLPMFPLATRLMRPPPCDVLVTLSHCTIKALRPPPGARHLCYCFTPMRYAWNMYDAYFGRNPLRSMLLKPPLAALRHWDRAVSSRVDLFVGISRHVQDRIKRFYGRDSELVYPPVKTDFFTLGPPGHEGFDLVVSALVPYKRVDLAVAAYTRLGYPLKVIGRGSEYPKLRKIAGPNVQFLEWPNHAQVLDHYRRCRFLIFPGEEDFGLVPVEAQACGKPVIAYAVGGAAETVVDGVTGVFFREQTTDALLAAVETAAARPWDPSRARAQAERFAPHHFIDGMKTLIARLARESSG